MMKTGLYSCFDGLYAESQTLVVLGQPRVSEVINPRVFEYLRLAPEKIGVNIPSKRINMVHSSSTVFKTQLCFQFDIYSIC